MSMGTIHFLPSTELRYYTVSDSLFSLSLLRCLPGENTVGMRPRRRSLRRTKRRHDLSGRRQLPLSRKNLRKIRRALKSNQQENAQLGVYQPVWRRKRVPTSVKPLLIQLSLTKNQRLREPANKMWVYYISWSHTPQQRNQVLSMEIDQRSEGVSVDLFRSTDPKSFGVQSS